MSSIRIFTEPFSPDPPLGIHPQRRLQIFDRKHFNIRFDITRINTNQVAVQLLPPCGLNKVEHRFTMAVQKGHENFNYLSTIYQYHEDHIDSGDVLQKDP